MKPTQPRFTNEIQHTIRNDNPGPSHKSINHQPNCARAPYLKPNLEPLGALNQIVRGASAKGVDCAGELDLATYPF